MSNVIDWAWCAGFYSGEGSVWYCKRTYRGHYSEALRVQIDQCDKHPLILFQIRIGNLGRLTGPYKPHNLGKRFVYKLSLCGSKASLALARMWSYLTDPKKEQANSPLHQYNLYITRKRG